MSAESVLRELESRSVGTAYTVTRTAEGAVIELNVADVVISGQLYERGFSSGYSIKLVLNELEHTYTREAQSLEIEYSRLRGRAGMQASLKRSGVRGTVREVKFGKVRRHDASDEAYEYSFDSREITEFVDGVLEASGWQRKLDRATRIGIGFAIGGGIFALLAAIGGIVVAIVL